MAAPAISIRNLDHLGLVAALCRELGIARMIDALLPKTPPFKVSHGEALYGRHDSERPRLSQQHPAHVPAILR